MRAGVVVAVAVVVWSGSHGGAWVVWEEEEAKETAADQPGIVEKIKNIFNKSSGKTNEAPPFTIPESSFIESQGDGATLPAEVADTYDSASDGLEGETVETLAAAYDEDPADAEDLADTEDWADTDLADTEEFADTDPADTEEFADTEDWADSLADCDFPGVWADAGLEVADVDGGVDADTDSTDSDEDEAADTDSTEDEDDLVSEEKDADTDSTDSADEEGKLMMLVDSTDSDSEDIDAVREEIDADTDFADSDDGYDADSLEEEADTDSTDSADEEEEDRQTNE